MMIAASSSNHSDLPQTPRSLSKSHDDGDVKYFFQRPEQDTGVNSVSGGLSAGLNVAGGNRAGTMSKWSGDDSLLEIQSGKKMWNDERFLNEWTSNTGDRPTTNNNTAASNHTVSQPIPMQRRPGGSGTSLGPNQELTNASGGLLSPKSVELKLQINYILEDDSPSVKELETRLKSVKIGANADEAISNSNAANDSINPKNDKLNTSNSKEDSSTNNGVDVGNSNSNDSTAGQRNVKQPQQQQQVQTVPANLNIQQSVSTGAGTVVVHPMQQQQLTVQPMVQQTIVPPHSIQFDQRSYETTDSMSIESIQFDYSNQLLQQQQQQQLIESNSYNDLLRNSMHPSAAAAAAAAALLNQPSQFLLQQQISQFNQPPYFQDPYLGISYI